MFINFYSKKTGNSTLVFGRHSDSNCVEQCSVLTILNPAIIVKMKQ